jgi:Cft2 family RNA processing exonuclease
MICWEDGLRVRDSALYLDSRFPRALSFVSHAHSDHIAEHEVAIATPATLALAERRIGLRDVVPLPFGQEHRLGDSRVRLTSAGHVLGSAMIHYETDSGSLLYTGDFKLRSCLTVPAAEPIRADCLIMESTFGKPMFRFPPWRQVADQLVDLVAGAMRSGRQPIVMGYSLGKAQEIVRILTDAGFPVTEHGAVANLSGVYEQQGVSLGPPRRRYAASDFRGPKALPLEERGVLVAPPNVARSFFVDQFEDKLTIMLSGWALLKGAQFRYGVDHVLPISDHADFDELLELIERVEPKEILTVHGFPEFADTLRDRGHKARTAKPEAQMRLFE